MCDDKDGWLDDEPERKPNKYQVSLPISVWRAMNYGQPGLDDGDTFADWWSALEARVDKTMADEVVARQCACSYSGKPPSQHETNCPVFKKHA